MADAGLLRSAVMAVNDARTKTWFDNRYGTAQSCVFAVADLLDVVGRTVRDQPAVVVGYGPVGEGVAAVLRALGADVAVAEVDPVRALRALHDGFEVAPLAERAAGALVVSATGRAGTVPRAIAESSAVVAVAGGVPGEVDDLPGAEPVAPGIDRLPGGALLLGGGGAVNITAAEGNPIEIMDLSFAVQLAALGELLATRPAPGVHAVSATVDDLIARAALAARGVSVDAPDVGVARAADGWRSPRFAHRSGT
jgi:adenosylhomocysteinase